MLGYPADARLLIVNADDFGMCHAVNEAIVGTLKAGVVRSTTLMVSCPWALHAMQFLAAHPGTPFGVHLTAISEWPSYRWGPVSAKAEVPTLLDKAGYFYDFDHGPAFLAQVSLAELEREWRAQIEAVLAAGLKPSHLDWHALRIDNRPDVAAVMFKLAREYGLALRVRGRTWIGRLRDLGLPGVDSDFLDSYGMDPVNKASRYVALLAQLPEGLSEWAVHPGLDTPELLAIEAGVPRTHGAGTRQTDYDFLTSQVAQDAIRKEGIVLLDYRALQAVWRETAVHESNHE